MVLFSQPTSISMLPCRFFLDGRCKFDSDKCKFSHGEKVSVEKLKEYTYVVKQYSVFFLFFFSRISVVLSTFLIVVCLKNKLKTMGFSNFLLLIYGTLNFKFIFFKITTVSA